MKVLKFRNSSYFQCVQYSVYVFSMLSLGFIVISHLVVADLFIYSLSGMILCTILGRTIFTLMVFLHEILSLL